MLHMTTIRFFATFLNTLTHFLPLIFLFLPAGKRRFLALQFATQYVVFDCS